MTKLFLSLFKVIFLAGCVCGNGWKYEDEAPRPRIKSDYNVHSPPNSSGNTWSPNLANDNLPLNSKELSGDNTAYVKRRNLNNINDVNCTDNKDCDLDVTESLSIAPIKIIKEATSAPEEIAISIDLEDANLKTDSALVTSSTIENVPLNSKELPEDNAVNDKQMNLNDIFEHWAPLCKTGKSQSPVALGESIATLKEFHPIALTGYGQITTALLKNNGHSAEVRLQNIEAPSVHGGGLPGVYKLDHLHFHWQSEHTMNNYRFPLELHLVHYHQRYHNLTQAVQHTHGVAVLGVLFDLSPDDDDDFQPLLEIIDNLKETVGEPQHLKDFSPKNFVPRNRAGYYRYHGSLTTPGCNEGIIWTVFTNTLPISVQQVKIFEDILTHDKTPLIKNYRSLQPLNDRKVYLKVSPIRDSASTQHISTILSLSLLGVYIFYSRLL